MPEVCRIVFWNTNRRDLTQLLCNMIIDTSADVVILIENLQRPDVVLQCLRSNVDEKFHIPSANPDGRFQCYSRNLNLDLSEVHDAGRISIRKLILGKTSALLGLVHGPDIRNHDMNARQQFAQSIGSQLQYIKDMQSNNNFILIGDFNLNPYDPGMNLAMGLNAMMTKSCVRPGRRKHQGKEYDFYYNPMWSLLGDGTDGPAGTIYDTSSQGPYGWSMLDQVIVNYSVVNLFKDVKILDRAGNVKLANARGRPNKRLASDHFPILLSLTGGSHV